MRRTELFKCFSLKSFQHLQAEQHHTVTGGFWGLQESCSSSCRHWSTDECHLSWCIASTVMLDLYNRLKNESKQTFTFNVSIGSPFHIFSFLFSKYAIQSDCICIFSCFWTFFPTVLSCVIVFTSVPHGKKDAHIYEAFEQKSTKANCSCFVSLYIGSRRLSLVQTIKQRVENLL